MSSKKKSGFSYKFYSCILILVIGGVIYYDTRQHGSWNKSCTVNALKRFGLLEYVNKVTDRSSEGIYWLHQQIDNQVPGYYEKTAEIAHPYIQAVKEFGLVMAYTFENIKNVAIKKYPVIVSSIESYAPGAIEESQKFVSNAWSSSVFYFHRSIDYLKTEVFVGQLAPENMQKVVLEAFNTTQQKAVEYYQWVYDKVQSSMK